MYLWLLRLTSLCLAGYANFANLKIEPALRDVRTMPQFSALLAQYPERDAPPTPRKRSDASPPVPVMLSSAREFVSFFSRAANLSLKPQRRHSS